MYANMAKKLVIWGASGHARVIADIVRLQGLYEVVGFIDDISPERHRVPFVGVKILGGQEQLDQLLEQNINHIILGFGDCEARLRLAELVLSKGFEIARAVHPQTIIAQGTPIGAGTVIAAGAIINPGTTIGANVIINTAASVDHDSVIEDGVHICPGVHLGGHTIVRRSTLVGIGASVKDRVEIGSNSIIGAGAVVVKDIPDHVMAYGVPARVIKKIE